MSLVKGTLYVRKDPELLNNKIFSGQPLYGMKSDNYPFVALRNHLRTNYSIDLATQDLHPPEESILVISLDEAIAFQHYEKRNHQILYLIVSEPPVYCPENWDTNYHGIFDKVFNYEKAWADGRKYVYYNFPIEFEHYKRIGPLHRIPFKERKFCAMVAGALSVGWKPEHDHTLLYERFRAIKWFSKNAPEKLDFFSRNFEGKQLDDFKGAGILKKLKINLLVQWIARRNKRIIRRVYRGPIEALKKIQILSEYKFSICYENSRGINGIISEKIFDCFAAGVVPVYWGASDVKELIPESCFIDRTRFRNYSELFKFLDQMDENTFQGYQESIANFLQSMAVRRFTVDHYVETIFSGLQEDLKKIESVK